MRKRVALKVLTGPRSRRGRLYRWETLHKALNRCARGLNCQFRILGIDGLRAERDGNLVRVRWVEDASVALLREADAMIGRILGEP